MTTSSVLTGYVLFNVAVWCLMKAYIRKKRLARAERQRNAIRRWWEARCL